MKIQFISTVILLCFSFSFLGLAEEKEYDWRVDPPLVANQAAALDLEVCNGYIYVACLKGGVKVFDARDVNNIKLLRTLNIESSVGAITSSGRSLFVSCAKGCLVYDISDLENPRLLTTLLPSKEIEGVAIGKNVCYVLESKSGIYTYDISDAKIPKLLSTPDKSQKDIVSVSASDKYAVISGGERGYKVFKLGAPLLEAPIYTVDNGDGFKCETENDLLAYIDRIRTKVRLKRIGDDGSILTSHEIDMETFLSYLALKDKKLFTGFWDKLKVYDVADITTPILIEELKVKGCVYNLRWMPQRLYVAAGSGGVLLYDFTKEKSFVFNKRIVW